MKLTRQFLDFEQPIKELYEQIEENKRLSSKNPKVEYDSIVKKLEESILLKRKQITEQGYSIVLNLGDQKGDLRGGYAEKAFKLPNPYYLVP